MNKVIIALIAVVVMTGCNKPGMNKKLALADSLSVVAVGATLDEAARDSSENFVETQAKVIDVANGLLAFVSTGEFVNLPTGAVDTRLKEYIAEKGWGEYVGIVDTAMTYVRGQQVDTDVIGENNVLLIKTSLEAIIRQAERSKAAWAVPIRD